MKPLSFQDIILKLQTFWSTQGCVIMQPYDSPMGAGTFHPATVLKTIGPRPWKVAYVQPCRRPTDGRYGDNPNRLQHFYQFQVILKPSPQDCQDLYLKSLVALGIDLKNHDIRFVEDNWEGPTLGASGMGWEVWCDGMEITQFTYFQQMGGLTCHPVSVELTYGLERIACMVQDVSSLFDIDWNGAGVSYGDVYHLNEQQFSAYNFDHASVDLLLQHFKDAEQEAHHLLRNNLPLAAYDQCLMASHTFNLLDARGVISVIERASYIARVRQLAKASCEALMKDEG